MSNWNFFRLRMNINGEVDPNPVPEGTVRTVVFVAALTETTGTWSNVTSTSVSGATGTGWDPCADPLVNGEANSDAIIAQSGHTNSAAKYCLDFSSGGYDDWYLGSNTEVTWMIRDIYNSSSMQDAITNAGGDEIDGSNYYWSSRQSTINDDKATIAKSGVSSTGFKSSTRIIRPQKTLIFNPTTQYSKGDLALGGIVFRVFQLEWGDIC